ncbi:hypothetical protein [Haloprofundus halobius]|uniref:hypothetical protein n=1 Tax=Haloprofundus halobius TaxID=2876194 RepID=UPI001CCBD454|nr:hypothetical protein [Haloprofundus halobius]
MRTDAGSLCAIESTSASVGLFGLNVAVFNLKVTIFDLSVTVFDVGIGRPPVPFDGGEHRLPGAAARRVVDTRRDGDGFPNALEPAVVRERRR